MLSVIIRAYATAVSMAGSRNVKRGFVVQTRGKIRKTSKGPTKKLKNPFRNLLLPFSLLLLLAYLRFTMNTFAAISWILLASLGAYAQPCASVECADTLFRNIYALKLPKREAAPRVAQLRTMLRKLWNLPSTPAPASDNWVFPLQGYTPAAIGGKGTGYRGERGYDFFQGNAHGGHPAHDVFIRDRNFDDLDDRTGKPVDVLSISSGIIVSISGVWKPDSMDAKKLQVLRGGICVWVYDPVRDGLFYYAHLRSVSCAVGQRVSAGGKLGEVGRTGKNAFPHRSPTHLHLMYLDYSSGIPKPRDIYSDLLHARLVK